jgi:outer membrane lipoprotein-sorting protein
MATRITCTGAAACLVGLLVWLSLSGSWESIAFADVQEKLERTQNVTLKVSLKGEGPEQFTQVTTTRSGMMRVETSNGDIIGIVNPKQRRSLELKVKEKKAVLKTHFSSRQTSLFQKLRSVHEDPIKRLPDREVDGKRAIGFLVVLEDTEFPSGTEASVWVDPHTRLPVRLEMAEAGGKDTIIMEEIVFDCQLDNSLFDTTPPAGYTVESEGLVDIERRPLPPLVLTPKVGIGDVRFGMSKEEVIRLLGQPALIVRQNPAKAAEQWEQILENIPAEQKVVRRNLRETISRLRQSTEVRDERLEYRSSGLSIGVDPDDGVTGIAVDSQRGSGGRFRDFIGRTKEGIALGASLEDIHGVYGTPSLNANMQPMLDTLKASGFGPVFYPELGLTFTLWDHRVCSFSAVPVAASSSSPTQPGGGRVDPGLEVDVDPYPVIEGKGPMGQPERPAVPAESE